MTIIKNEILDIANQASLKILIDNKTFEIKHILNFKDKSIIGIILFMCGGVFLLVIPFVKTLDTTSKVLAIAIGLPVFILSILTFVRQFTDKFKISGAFIEVQHNLKRTTIPISENMEVKMKTKILKIRRISSRSDFLIVSYYLEEFDNENPVLQFQMDNNDSIKAFKLGNEIKRVINERFRELN